MNDEISRLEEKLKGLEPGTKDYIVCLNLLMRLKKEQSETAQYLIDEKDKIEERKTSLKTAVLTVCGTLGAALIGIVGNAIIEDKRNKHTLEQIDEICRFEQDDTFSGSKKTLATKVVK